MRNKRRPRVVNGLDFKDGQAVVIQADDWPEPSWCLWHIRKDDGPDSWVRRDWLQEVETGFQFGEETYFEWLHGPISPPTYHEGRPIIRYNAAETVILCPAGHFYDSQPVENWAGSWLQVKVSDVNWTVRCCGTLPADAS